MPLPHSPLGPRPDAGPAAIVPFHKSSTYVVQVPKDQIFRVPPPENALIVEAHRNRLTTARTSRRPCCSRFASLFAALAAASLLSLCGAVVFYYAADPSAPHVSVDRVALSGTSFDVRMKARNPSRAMDFRYTDGGRVEMFHQGKRIAAGDARDFDIGHDATAEIEASLQGSRATLPKEMRSAAGGSKDVFRLSLSANFPVRLGFGAFRRRRKEMGVDCDLKVSKVGKEMYVKSQNCKASFS